MKSPNKQHIIAQLVANELAGREDYYVKVFEYERGEQYNVAIAFDRCFIPGRMARDIGLLCTKHNVSWFVSDVCSADHQYPLYIIIY